MWFPPRERILLPFSFFVYGAGQLFVQAPDRLQQHNHREVEQRKSSCREDPAVIKKILAHLDEKALSAAPCMLPECRAPPGAGLFEGL
jgi:hypothetical protein